LSRGKLRLQLRGIHISPPGLYDIKGKTMKDRVKLLLLVLCLVVSDLSANYSTVGLFDQAAQGSGLAFINLTDQSTPYLVSVAYRKESQTNLFVYQILGREADGSLFSLASHRVPGVGWEAQGAGVAVTQLDTDPNPELILMAYDNPAGVNSFRYRIVWNLREKGYHGGFSPIYQTAGIGDEAQGAGAAIGQIDTDPRPDLVFAAYDTSTNESRFVYRVGWNLDVEGVAERWSDPIAVSGVAVEAQGAAVEIVKNAAGNHLFLMAYENPPQGNRFLYRVGIKLDQSGQAQNWSAIKRLPGVGWEGEGAGLAIYSGPTVQASTNTSSLPTETAVVAAIDPANNGRELRAYRFKVDGNGGPEAFKQQLPNCTSELIEEQEFVRTQMQGVTYADGRGRRIGSPAAKKPLNWWIFPIPLGKNWYPVDQFRHTLCGNLHHFNYFMPSGGVASGREADFNSFFEPNDVFQFLIDDVRSQRSNTSDWHRCDGELCMEGEVTASQHFAHNPWFVMKSGPKGKSVLEGRDVCTYGPWVTEESHNFRPEIHPSESYWWSVDAENAAAENSWQMLLFLDESNRFTKPEHYAGGTRPEWWLPWASQPIWGSFRLPFNIELDSDSFIDELYYVSLDNALSRAVSTQTLGLAGEDTDEGEYHALMIDDEPVLAVRELLLTGTENKDLGVSFDQLCLSDSRSRLHGYVKLTVGIAGTTPVDAFATLGVDRHVYEPITVNPTEGEDPRKQAFLDYLASLELTYTSENRPGQIQQRPELQRPKIEPKLTLIENSIRMVRLDGQRQLVADFMLERQPANLNTASLNGLNRRIRDLSIHPTQPGGTLKLESLPLGHQMRLALNTSDRSLNLSLPEPRISMTVDTSALVRTPVRMAGLRKWPQALAAERLSDMRILSLQEVSILSVPVALQYVPIRNGEAAHEDSSAMGRAMSQQLNSMDSISQLYGTNNPFETEWEVVVKNMVNGQTRVLSHSGRAFNANIRLPENLIKDRLKIDISPNSDLLKIDITIKARDPFGFSGVTSQTFWSHAISGPEQIDTFAKAVVQLASGGMNRNQLAQVFELPESIPLDPRRDQSERKLRRLGAVALQSVSDQQLDPGELMQLMAIANPTIIERRPVN